MATSDQLLTASSKANKVILDLDLKRRVQEGYTRVDPNLVASSVGVPVMYRKLERLLGGFIRDDGVVGILVNSDRPRGLVHMTCAHELGHYFLDHASTADEKIEHGTSATAVEQQADQFAYSLLAPRWLIAGIMKANKWTTLDLQNEHVVYQLSLRLGISYTAMVWSLYRLQLIKYGVVNRIVSLPPKSLKVSALQGNSLEHANADVWVLSEADRDRIIEPGYGDKFVISLPNHSGSGHLWTVDEARSEGFELRPVAVDARQLKPTNRDSVIVGSGSQTLSYHLQPPEKFRKLPDYEDELDLIDERRRAVELREQRPWTPQTTVINTLDFSAEFEAGSEGLTIPERRARIERVLHKQ